MGKEHIVIVDDQEVMRDSLATTLTRQGYRVSAFENGHDMLGLLETNSIDLVITDLKMPEMDGIEVLERVRASDPVTPVIVITAFGTIETAVDAMRKGAFNFITKPFKADEIAIMAEKALEHARILTENQYFKDELKAQYNFDEMIGSSSSMKSVFSTIEKVAQSTNATVLIRGSSGTGKELVARAIHYQSARSEKTFIKVNCAALSAGLLESELFGHEKGAFTGADKKRKGRFEIANGGTLLLDEVSELSPDLQAKLLRVMQEREFEPVGSNETRKVDVRVLATTNRNLEEWVKEGKFREDLFYRLNVITIELPSLSMRREDIKPLINHFLEMKCHKEGVTIKTLSEGAWEYAQKYDWPGNIRELENTIERAIILSSSEEIQQSDLNDRPAPPSTSSDGAIDMPFGQVSLEDMEKELILGTLKVLDNHQKNAADILGVTARTLREKLKKWGVK